MRLRLSTGIVVGTVYVVGLLGTQQTLASVVPTGDTHTEPEVFQYSNATALTTPVAPFDIKLYAQSAFEVIKQGDWRFGRKLENFWYYVYEAKEKAVPYAQKILHEAATETAPRVAQKIREFAQEMEEFVKSCVEFRRTFSANAMKIQSGTKLNEVFAMLAKEFEVVLEELKAEFGPEEAVDKERRMQERERMVDQALEKIGVAVVKVAKSVNGDEEAVREHYDKVRPQLKRLLITIGTLVDEHPVLTETIILSVTMLLVPESWILRPLLGVFGFGPSGPVKGSAASWAQRRFWGAAVREGSWFALLQRAGMTNTASHWFWKIGVALGLSGTIASTCGGH